MTNTTSDLAFCANLVRTHDFERYVSTLFMPPDARRGVLALYAFAIEVSQVRYHVTQPMPGEIRLQWWSDMLARQGHGDVENNPVAAEVLACIETYAIDTAPLLGLIEDHQFDLYNDPMPTRADCEAYLARTEGTLFEAASRVLGHSSDAIDHLSRHAGIAFGGARLIARLPIDAARKQLFLPREHFEQHGVTVETLYAGEATPGIDAAVRQCIVDAREHVDQTLAELVDAPSSVRAAFLPIAMARHDLDRMASAGYDVCSLYRPMRLRILWTLWRASRATPFRV